MHPDHDPDHTHADAQALAAEPPPASQSAEVQSHYANLLAPIYGWMLGNREAALAAARAQLVAAGVGPTTGERRALDLGAGLGLHAIPLAELGYRVTAIDTSEELLGELKSTRPDVQVLVGDLVQAEALVDGKYDVIVCMGDTLTHMRSERDVARALAGARRLLAEGGTLLLSFRDYVSRARHGSDRFLLVRADDTRILTCCLDYEEAKVRVTDIVHERHDAHWTMRAHSYSKLRLSLVQTVTELETLGLKVERAVAEAGVFTILAASVAAT